MDKRSVLSDALAYLRSIHEQIAGIQEEPKRAGRNDVHASLQNAAYGAQHQGDVNALGRPEGEIVQVYIYKSIIAVENCMFACQIKVEGRKSRRGSSS